jgi:hypothetical protein
MAHNKGMRGSTSKVWALLLIFKIMDAICDGVLFLAIGDKSYEITSMMLFSGMGGEWSSSPEIDKR